MFSVIKKFLIFLKQNEITLVRKSSDFLHLTGYHPPFLVGCYAITIDKNNKIEYFIYVERLFCKSKLKPTYVLFHEVGHHLHLKNIPIKIIAAYYQPGMSKQLEGEIFATKAGADMMKSFGASPAQIKKFMKSMYP